jgi:hypothetical protein
MTPTNETRRAGGATGLGGSSFFCRSDVPKNSPIERPAQAQFFGGRRRVLVDFGAINRAALAALPAILRRLLPDGRIIGGEYVARNPTRADRRAGSFKINLRTGHWADFATGDKGGDPVSLCAYVEGASQAEAARRLARMLGLYTREGWRHG